jgi:hypothetical protein
MALGFWNRPSASPRWPITKSGLEAELEVEVDFPLWHPETRVPSEANEDEAASNPVAERDFVKKCLRESGSSCDGSDELPRGVFGDRLSEKDCMVNLARFPVE